MGISVTKSRAQQQAGANTETEQVEVLKTYVDGQGNVSHADVRRPGRNKPLPRVPNSSGIRLIVGMPVTLNWRQGSRYAPHITGAAGSSGGAMVQGAVGNSSGSGSGTTGTAATDYSGTGFVLVQPDADLPNALTMQQGVNVVFEDTAPTDPGDGTGPVGGNRFVHARPLVVTTLPDATHLPDGTVADMVDGSGVSAGMFRTLGGQWIRRDSPSTANGGGSNVTTADRNRWDTAGTNATQALTNAATAQTSANNASSAAGNAQSAASHAQTAADAAQSTANAAQSTANSAQSSANSAQTTASNAASAASAAQTSANNASSAASSAQSTATSAQNAASNAQSAAASAQSAANAAQSTANSAQSAAAAAQSTANAAQSTATDTQTEVKSARSRDAIASSTITATTFTSLQAHLMALWNALNNLWGIINTRTADPANVTTGYVLTKTSGGVAFAAPPSGGSTISDPLEVAHGGTGASTAADARTNLGAAPLAWDILDLVASTGQVTNPGGGQAG